MFLRKRREQQARDILAAQVAEAERLWAELFDPARAGTQGKEDGKPSADLFLNYRAKINALADGTGPDISEEDRCLAGMYAMLYGTLVLSWEKISALHRLLDGNAPRFPVLQEAFQTVAFVREESGAFFSGKYTQKQLALLIPASGNPLADLILLAEVSRQDHEIAEKEGTRAPGTGPGVTANRRETGFEVWFRH